MKLTEFLSDVGRPIAYYPGLRRITGSTTATILICQLIYWTGKEQKGDGWIYKSSEELESETGLSYDEQKTAREKLVSAGILQERYARLEHRMYFRVDTDALNALWEIPETGNAKMGNADSPVSTKAESRHSLIESEITKEYNTGANAPMPIDWQIGSQQINIVVPTAEQEFDASVDIACMSICRYGADLEPLARAFFVARRILPGKKDVKGWASAFREMKTYHVTADIVTLSVQELTAKGLTIADPWAIKKTAINKAVPASIQTNQPIVTGGNFYA